MDVTVEIPLTRFGEWKTSNLTAKRYLGDGICLLASIQQEVDDEGESRYCTTIYRKEYNRYGLLQNHKLLRRETFGYLWDAVHYCETVDLSEFGITIK